MKSVPMTMHVATPKSASEFSYARVAQSLARDYIMMYYVNAGTGEFVRYVTDEDEHDYVASMWGDDFFNDIRDIVLPDIHPDDRETFLAASTKENVLHVLSVDRSLILNFRMDVRGRETHLEIKVTRMTGADNEHIVVGVMDIEAHTKRIAEYERARSDSHTFSSILEAMTTDYLAIFYLDMPTGDYVEYDPSRPRSDMRVNRDGRDFFHTRGKDILERVHVDDRPAIAKTFSPENILSELASVPALIRMCRLDRCGREVFVNVKATRIAGDSRHVVIGINDVDDQVRREEAHVAALSAAQAVANRDPLTGVKSKHAYTEAERDYDRSIKGGSSPARDFAVVVCDVNDLKYVNDTFGHKAGDEHIRKACRLICSHFKRSPVYRVGGDEFVVILNGDDYDQRESLLASLNAQVEDNQHAGGVVVAIGAADYARGRDRGFASVFDRADQAMYVRKLELKAMRSL